MTSQSELVGPPSLEKQLGELGVTQWGEFFYQPNLDTIYNYALRPDAQMPAVLTTTEALAVTTGEYTGRATKAKGIVERPDITDDIWWAGEGNPYSGNNKISGETFDKLLELSLEHLNDQSQPLFVVDRAAIAEETEQIGVRLITHVPTHAMFAQNMFRPLSLDKEKSFEPDWTILGVSGVKNEDYEKLGIPDKAFVVIDFKTKLILIGGTEYAGEIKKSIFSAAYGELPPKGIAVLHCSSIVDRKGKTHLSFGLSGTGKTTLSHDEKAGFLLGDDEHAWGKLGISNFEGGCYAKGIGITPQSEPLIVAAAESGRGVLLENVVIDKQRKPDYSDESLAVNSRISYPMDRIPISIPEGTAGHPETAVFLSMDAFGVLPPIALLTPEEAMYYYISGYTAKVAGTEKGLGIEPKPTFSSCFAGPFLALHPVVNAELLRNRINEHNTRIAIVNTGYAGGIAGQEGINRVPLSVTRGLVRAFQAGEIEWDNKKTNLGPFSFTLPKHVPEIKAEYYNPRNLWPDPAEYDRTARKLGEMFTNNFSQFSELTTIRELANQGPQL
jgi:phosphoenolpyruvate carboxykinase (ATP)